MRAALWHDVGLQGRGQHGSGARGFAAPAAAAAPPARRRTAASALGPVGTAGDAAARAAQAAAGGVFRVVLVPVHRRGWVFCPERVLLLAPPGPCPSWADVRAQPTLGGKWYALLSRQLHWGEEHWWALQNAPRDTRLGRLKHWVFETGTSLAARTVGPEEAFLKSIPEGAVLEVVYPHAAGAEAGGSLPQRLVRRRLRLLARQRERYHRRGRLVNLAVLPFTSLMLLLPTPNWLFYWNLFRLHSHYRAKLSCKALLKLRTCDAGRLRGSAERADAPVRPGAPATEGLSVTFTGSDELAALVGDGVNEAVLKAIAERFSVPELPQLGAMFIADAPPAAAAAAHACAHGR